MSDKCGNCDCADKTQCPKKGNSYGVVMVVEAEKTTHFEEAAVAEAGCENGGQCKCGTACSCGATCNCGH